MQGSDSFPRRGGAAGLHKRSAEDEGGPCARERQGLLGRLGDLDRRGAQESLYGALRGAPARGVARDGPHRLGAWLARRAGALTYAFGCCVGRAAIVVAGGFDVAVSFTAVDDPARDKGSLHRTPKSYASGLRQSDKLSRTAFIRSNSVHPLDECSMSPRRGDVHCRNRH